MGRTNRTITTKLRRERVRRGLTQEALEASSGVSQATISMLETRAPLGVLSAIRVARALGVTVEELFGEAVPAAERTHGHTRRRPVVHTTND